MIFIFRWVCLQCDFFVVCEGERSSCGCVCVCVCSCVGVWGGGVHAIAFRLALVRPWVCEGVAESYIVISVLFMKCIFIFMQTNADV